MSNSGSVQTMLVVKIWVGAEILYLVHNAKYQILWQQIIFLVRSVQWCWCCVTLDSTLWSAKALKNQRRSCSSSIAVKRQVLLWPHRPDVLEVQPIVISSGIYQAMVGTVAPAAVVTGDPYLDKATLFAPSWKRERNEILMKGRQLGHLDSTSFWNTNIARIANAVPVTLYSRVTM